MDLKKLEQTGALQTLLYLYSKKRAAKTDITKNIVATFDTLNKTTFPNLEELGLITLEIKSSFPVTHFYTLTEKGELLAKCLYNIT